MPADVPLGLRYAGLVCDLDGVVRRGSRPVPHAAEQLTRLREHAVRVVYATNNASLTPQEVAAQLCGLGLTVSADEVVTSSQAAAAHLARSVPAGSAVLAVGGPGVAAALVEAGLRPARTSAPEVVAVLQGYGPLVSAADLAEAAYAVQGGATWVATNVDTTLPTDRGTAPGNGALVAAVALATGTQPDASTGKPAPPLYDLAVARLGLDGPRVLAIGDRLDTDILGAMAAGLDCLWVTSGVDDLESFARAPGRPVPTYVGADLRVLAAPPRRAVESEDGWTCGSSRLRLQGSRVTEIVGPRDPNALLTLGVAALVHCRDERGAGPEELAAIAAAVGARLG